MFKRITFILLVGLLAWAYQATRPPPPNICGSPGGPPVTASRIRLRDGRFLAYKEHGVPKQVTKYKIIFVHPFFSSRHDPIIATAVSPEVIEDLGVYIVSFDRPGHGESDPDPKRTTKSLALDIEEEGAEAEEVTKLTPQGGVLVAGVQAEVVTDGDYNRLRGNGFHQRGKATPPADT
ncbi:uncharacterized protein [Malus domestica]